jgi:hypothetical protein
MECAPCRVAEQAKDPTNAPGFVAVVNLFRRPLRADRTESSLCGNHCVDLACAYFISLLQVVVTLAARLPP